jgi:hypothetical protein
MHALRWKTQFDQLPLLAKRLDVDKGFIRTFKARAKVMKEQKLEITAADEAAVTEEEK